MSEIEITKLSRIACEQTKSFDIALYAKKIFGMFSGDDETVRIRFENRLVGVVIDRFGKEIILEKDDEQHFIAHLNVSVSPLFLSWIIAFGDGAKVLSPDSVIKQVVNLCGSVSEQYI